jgi:hypothetical protein
MSANSRTNEPIDVLLFRRKRDRFPDEELEPTGASKWPGAAMGRASSPVGPRTRNSTKTRLAWGLIRARSSMIYSRPQNELFLTSSVFPYRLG